MIYSWKIAGTLFLLYSLYRIGKVVINVRHRSKGIMDALLYALHIQFSRIPLVYGQIKGMIELLFRIFTLPKKTK